MEVVYAQTCRRGNRVSINIRPATIEDVFAIKAFNQRLVEGNAEFQFPETPYSLGVAREAHKPVWHELFIASDGSLVRAGYALKREMLSVRRSKDMIEIWNYQIPLSEGVVDKSFATLGIRLLQDAMARHERLYCLGMGSLARPLPRLLQRFAWKLEEVPFRFRVLQANRFLMNIAFLRTSRKNRMLLELARWSGAGALCVFAWQLLTQVRGPYLPRALGFSDLTAFGAEADDIFQRVSALYGAVIDRSTAALNVRFPSVDERLIRITARLRHENIGWVVISHSQCRAHKQFGDMRLGCIVDGLCDPRHAELMVRLATDRLVRERVDLIVSNQTHHAWLRALRRNGFASGPSNFIFARSPVLATETPAIEECHINRGDGDGPINL